ncbi:MAG: quinone oxidoreductase [Xanthobacteraceae bacterium]|nr:quinone oxidoreductase [Xanthobacteraceae bacterium]
MAFAVRVYEHGGPEVLKYEEVTLPEPGAGEVRVKQTAVGLNFIDTYFRTGLYKPAAYPFVPGNEGAGVVVSVGKGVKGFKKGDRVAYGTVMGSYATERNLPADKLIKLPKRISDKTAAAMMLKGLTAQYLLRSLFKVKKKHVVLVHAAAGGVGQILTQWANALGATVIGTVGSKEKAAIAKKNGCHHVILYRDEDVAKRVAEITKGKKCDVVYDGVGKSTFMSSLDSLKPRGMLVSYGNASGPVDGVNLGILATKGSLIVSRPTMAHYFATRKELEAGAKDLMKVVEKGKVKIQVNQTYPLKEAQQAHRDLEARNTTGQTVLLP